MGVNAAVFDSAGKRSEHYVPGVYSRSHNVTSPSGVSSGNLCILGSAASGKPATLYEFGSLADAKSVLGSGELLEAIGYAFNGSNDFIPQRVYGMRVNGGTQASLTLKNGDTDIVELKAWDYSAATNQLKLMVDSGTVAGSKKIICVYKDIVAEVDNIQKKSMQVIGSCTNPKVTVNADSIFLSGEDDEGNPISETIRFEDFPTINEVVSRINDTDWFVATSLDADSRALSSNLDTSTSQDISEVVTLTSNFKAFVDALKTINLIGEVTVKSVARVVPENTSYEYFTGGSSDPVSTADWITALEMLESENIQIIATPSTDEEVQTLIVNHCTSMSTTENRKERTFWLGGTLNETDDAAIAKAVGFNNRLGSYVTDCAITNNPLTGAKETINGAMVSCMLAGMESAMAINTPLTNKTMKVLGFVKKRTLTNMEKLIKAGVCVCNASPDDVSNYVVIRALTTYQSDDLINNERSMVREDLYMNRDLRNRYAKSVGTAERPVPALILTTLNQAAKDWNAAGYIVPSDANENVWNKSVKIIGDKVYVTYSRFLTAPTNFVFITATNHVYTSTVEV